MKLTGKYEGFEKMLNKRKLIGNLIDLVLIIFVNTCVVYIILKLLSFFTLNMNVIFFIILLIDVLTIVGYLLPYLFKKEKTIGKLIVKKLIKKEDAKFTFKEIIILLIILLIISFI